MEERPVKINNQTMLANKPETIQKPKEIQINVQSVHYTVIHPNPGFDISGPFRLKRLGMYSIFFQHMMTGLRAS